MKRQRIFKLFLIDTDIAIWRYWYHADDTATLTANMASATILLGCQESWWRHQMETFSVLLAICAGNSPVPG